MRLSLATNNAIRISVCAALFSGVGGGQGRSAGAGRTVDVCTAIENGSHDGVTLRGTGRITPDGFVVGDRTCPVAKTTKDELPSVILVEIVSFSTNSDKATFDKSHFSRHGVSEPFQALVHGDLKCQATFRFQTSDDGDIVTGNGYGSNGLMKCKLVKAQVLMLRELE